MSFDNEKYLSAQTDEILGRLRLTPAGGNTYIEFGGKAYDDQHASRVLPGYDPHVKLRLLESLAGTFEIVVVVGARDILKPRIRGDTQLFYDNETIRLVKKLGEIGIAVSHGVVSMVRTDYIGDDRARLDRFAVSAQDQLGIAFVEHRFIEGYPSPRVIDAPGAFASCPKIPCSKKNVLLISPGGGSGKFGVCLSQLFHDFRAGINSSYLKFETFPIHDLSADHPLNLAFMAATADLGNTLHATASPYGGFTEYDKDMENVILLRQVVRRHCPDPESSPLSGDWPSPQMSVNKVLSGVLDLQQAAAAAAEEIRRRIERYKSEIERRIEQQSTIKHIADQLPEALKHLAQDVAEEEDK